MITLKDRMLTEADGFQKSKLNPGYNAGTTGKFFKPEPEGILKKPKNYYRNMSDEQFAFHAGIFYEAVRRLGINGRQEFEREYGRLYQEICRRGIQNQVGFEEKIRPKKYDSYTTDQLVEEALPKILRGGMRNVKEFCDAHRWLYNPLTGRDGPEINGKLSKMENKILDYGIRYAKEHGIKDDFKFAADCSPVYNVMYNWKLLPLMKYETPASPAKGKA